MRGILAGTLGLSLALLATAGRAQELKWRPVLGRPVAVAASEEEFARVPPAVTLGRPVALEPEGPDPLSAGGLRPVSFDAPEPFAPRVVRAQGPEGGPTLAVPGPAGPPAAANPAEQYNCGVANQNPGAGHSFLSGCKNFFSGLTGMGKGPFDSNGGHHLFESDHGFNDYISPVSNPFFFEDPRALTEVRPLFIYQGTPSNSRQSGQYFHGGDIEYFGLQGRLAFTERLSLVVSEFGGIWSEPHGGFEGFDPHSGFAQINLGPKYTFLRNEGCGLLGAAGLNFILPAGDRQVQQDTGSLTLEPYVSFGQRFGHNKYGTFHGLETLGYNASIDNQRSDNVFLSLHLDFDYKDLHAIYPLIELNYFHYTQNGKARDLDFEGRDLFNFGSQHVAGHDDASLALGARYQVNEHLQFGGAFEFPLISQHKDLQDFRVTFDVIFRY